MKQVRYPKVGTTVMAVGFWCGKAFSYKGKILPSKVNPKNPAWRARSGAVMASMELEEGRKVSIPWTSDENIIKFFVVNEEEQNPEN